MAEGGSPEVAAYTALTSPAFRSAGAGLLWWWHAHHILNKFWMTGRLSLWVTDWDKGTTVRLFFNIIFSAGKK